MFVSRKIIKEKRNGNIVQYKVTIPIDLMKYVESLELKSFGRMVQGLKLDITVTKDYVIFGDETEILETYGVLPNNEEV